MTKKNYILLAVFLFLLISAFAYQYFAPRWAERRNQPIVNPLADLDLLTADRLDMTSQDVKISYIIGDKGWQIDKSPYPLEKGRVEDFLKWLSESATSSAEIVSNAAQPDSGFGLDKTAKHIVIWRQGKKILDIKIGSIASADSGFYLTKDDKKEVYLIDYPLNIISVDWRSLNIADFKASDVSRLTLERDKSTYRYDRAGQGFVAQGVALEGYNATKAATVFSSLKAKGWPKQGQCLPNNIKLILSIAGKSQALELGKNTDVKKNDFACVRLAGQSAWYLIGTKESTLLFGK